MYLLSRFPSYSAKPALAGAWGVATYGELGVVLVIPPPCSLVDGADFGNTRQLSDRLQPRVYGKSEPR
jgi:hypothetical protein